MNDWHEAKHDHEESEPLGTTDTHTVDTFKPDAVEDAEAGADLNATLRGYDPEYKQEPLRESRICRACGVLGEFVNGRCQNCGFIPVAMGTAAPLGAAEQVNFAPEAESSGIGRIAIGALAVVLLGILAVIYVPKMFKKEASPAIEESSVVSATPTTVGAHAGALDLVELDEAFYTAADAAMEKANEAWAKSGVKAYVFRYGIVEAVVAATSQSLTVIAYVGGADHTSAVESNSEAFSTSLQAWLDSLNANDGVTAQLSLRQKGEAPSPTDRYIRFGQEWGEDHAAVLSTFIQEIESYKNLNGQYPLELSADVSTAKTKGNPNFISNGYGYIPVFKAGSDGNIVMGSGKGLTSYLPEEISGYYLVAFLDSETEGLDVWGSDALLYYNEHISPFPYKPPLPVKNMQAKPDGKPDGVACVFKNGKLVP